MLVRITKTVPGLTNGVPASKDDVHDFPEGLAGSLILDGYAEAVAEPEPEPKPEVEPQPMPEPDAKPDTAEARETRTVSAPEKRGPGRPRKA